MNDNKALMERAEKIKSKLRHCKSYKTKIELQTTMLEAADTVNQLISQYLAVTDEWAAQLAEKDKQLAAANKALRLSIAAHSTDERQIERLMRYYLAEASGPQEAGEVEHGD